MPLAPELLPPCHRLFTLRLAAVAIGLAVAALSSGCVSSMQLVAQQPSALTQLLVTRSLERALVQLDVTRLSGRKVSLDFYSQSPAQNFAKEFVTTWLEARSVHVAHDAHDAKEFAVKVFASAVGSDRGESFVGIPSIQAPVIGFPIPEIAIFKWARNRGLSELLVYVFDGTTNALVETIGPTVGHSKQDDFTFLIVLSFTVSDLDERLSPPGHAPAGSAPGP